MVAALWEIASELDDQRISAKVTDAIWVEIQTARLRGPGGRDDNGNLRQWLKRLSKIEIEGEYRGDPWGAVMVAEWHILKNGSLARILIPPSAVRALRSAETFAKIETTAAHQLPGHARRLYALLADKKRLGKPEWTYDLGELRELMGVAATRSYARWGEFARTVLNPALIAINDYGTVAVTMETVKQGRTVTGVKFSWSWKTMDDAHVTVEENERHSAARRKAAPSVPDAPPLVETAPAVTREELDGLVTGLSKSLRVPDERPPAV